MRSYILSIIATALFCAITKLLLDEKTAIGQILRLLCSILLSVVILAPIKNISFQEITSYFEDITLTAESYSEQGSTSAQESKYSIIKEQTEAYILDKANHMGLDITVEVALGENDMIPKGVTVFGTVSPYAKEVMETFMEDTLGITKENQQWK